MKLKRFFVAALLTSSVILSSLALVYAGVNTGTYGYAYRNVEGRDGLYKINAGTVRRNGAQQSSINVIKTYYDGDVRTESSGVKNEDVSYTSGYEYIEDYVTEHKTYKNSYPVYSITLYK
ncbi:hypothetical protein [Lachnospira multipara]|uniref:Uncharacterized protein n=1 Tax=Lachnospira multipara TaxID=28051 RepID=A0A1H5UT14_9FIRM|nr:hypothetical protein [Lachnospira multipara]SEF78120.1 hypothetical protein SAMN05216537_10888 [Lachnospira multipara]